MMKNVFPVIHLVLLTVVIYLTVGFVYDVGMGALEDMTPQMMSQGTVAVASETPQKKPFNAYAAITKRNIFNAAKDAGQGPVPDVDLESLQKTKLALVLLGTISGLGDDSYAVIEDKSNRTQDLYTVGDSVSGATIKMILRKKVVLSINGQDEVLEMTEDTATLPDHRVPGRVFDRRPFSGRADDTGEHGNPPRNVNLKRRQVESAFNNVNDLMKDVRIRPHFSQGKPDGLMLSSVSPNSIFSDMGLRSNDVITGVNGKKIQTVDDCMGVYRQLKDAAAVSLEIKRGGQKEVIHYNIQ